MAIYTLESIRAVARSKDERLELKDNDWIDEKIDHAFETVESAKQVFSYSEEIDLSGQISAEVAEFDIFLTQEVHSIYDVSLGGNFVQVTINNDYSLSVSLDIERAKAADDPTIKIRYFYYPKTPFTSIVMPPEVYHFFRHCLYVNLYGSLRDKENELYHQEQVDRFVREGTFTMPVDLEEVIPMKGGFDTSGSTVFISGDPLWRQ